jgi:hypothetical protein
MNITNEFFLVPEFNLNSCRLFSKKAKNKDESALFICSFGSWHSYQKLKFLNNSIIAGLYLEPVHKAGYFADSGFQGSLTLFI